MLFKQSIIAASISVMVMSCQEQSASKWTRMKFIQDKPILTHLNLGDSAHGHGDGMAFEAAISDTLGNEIGKVIGWLVTVDMEESDTLNPVAFTERFGTLTFDCGDENEIISQGTSSYPKNKSLMEPGIIHRRAIVGGTGKYKGITGQVTTTRNEDGTYIHELEVKMDE